jgi:hypothetical protein
MTRASRAAALALVTAAGLAACTGPPWYMGQPLNGHASIPRTRRNLSYKDLRAEAATRRMAGQPVLELRALILLDQMDRLEPEPRARLATLLEARAAEFHALGRAVPESQDLDRLARLAPALGAALGAARARAARAAGDAWLAVGALDDARASYANAARLGAGDLGFRFAAVAGRPPPATTPLAELRAAIAALPLRAVPPVALTYIARGGRDRATLARALAAAHQERLDGLTARAADALRAADAPAAVDAGGPDADVDGGASDVDGGAPDAAADAALAADAPLLPPAPLPVDLDGWLLTGLTVEGRLLPLVAAHPEVLEDTLRAVSWIDLALDEDETSTDVLELAAIVFGRAGRLGGTERMLMELAFATPDRAAGLERGAAVWERLGRGREACAQWIRAARWRDDAEDPTWRRAIACTRRDPGAGDWREIRGYVLARARPDRREAIAAALDAE